MNKKEMARKMDKIMVKYNLINFSAFIVCIILTLNSAPFKIVTITYILVALGMIIGQNKEYDKLHDEIFETEE